MCLSQTSVDSTVRVLSLSRFCPDFPENRVRCLSAVRILSGFTVQCLSVRTLSVLILSAVRILSGFRSITIVFRRQYALTYFEVDDDKFISDSLTSALFSNLKDPMYSSSLFSTSSIS